MKLHIHPIEVTTLNNIPSSILLHKQQHRVQHVLDSWRYRSKWWMGDESRQYWWLLTESLSIEIFLRNNTWFCSRIFD